MPCEDELVTDIVLVTGRSMPAVDNESPLLVAALRKVGADAIVAPWEDSLDWSAVPLVVVRSTWDYYASSERFLDWARQVEDVSSLRNPLEVLVWNSHKSYLIDLAARGIPTVPTTLVAQGTPGVEQARALAEHSHGDIVIKPAVSVGAIGALRVAASAEAAALHLSELVSGADALVQPLQPSVLTRGEVSLIYLGGQFSHAIRKVAAAGDYRVQSHHGGTVVSHVPTPAERETADATLELSPAPVSYARVDLVGEDPLLMELELIEPALFLDDHPDAADRFAAHLVDLLVLAG